jgi:hypothetical protein
MLKRVLIITYYWPPSGGAGVQRWLKFVKYLPEYGWEPVIYTPENPEIPAEDHSLDKDIPEGIVVIRTKIWEPYSAYKRFVGRKKDDKIKAGFLSEKKTPSFAENVAVCIRGNFFIPDARKFWIKPSVKFLVKYLKENPVDAIVSTGPPHSMHLIALGVKRKTGLPWLADFRDPWTNIDFYQELRLTAFGDKKHRKLEQDVLKAANKLVTVSWNWAKDFEILGAKNMEVITNGFDPDDFKEIQYKKSAKFEIIHLGSLNKDRNPIRFWEAIHELCKLDKSFRNALKITLIGQTDYSVIEAVTRFDLSDLVEKIDYKPHREVLQIAGNASVLLLPLNNTPHVSGIVPGKIFEYLALKRPILGIGPIDGDSARIISECKAGEVVGFEDKETIKSVVNRFYKGFISGGQVLVLNLEADKYSRKVLTGKISELLNEIR